MKRIFILTGLLLYAGLGYGQKAEKQTIGGIDYAVVDCSGMPRGSVKTTAELAASKTADGRVIRHYQHNLTSQSSIINGTTDPNGANNKLSARFIVAPQDITASGVAVTGNYMVGWSDAGGYAAADNNLAASSETASAASGCAAYNGPSGTDTAGTWRLPTMRELQLVYVLYPRLNSLGATNWTDFNSGWVYVSATEQSETNCYSVDFGNGSNNIVQKNMPRYGAGYVRCVRDL